MWSDLQFLRLIIFGVLVLLVHISVSTVDVDANGYIAYCPCMGRFGNQADQFLGSLGFAHALNRTLVLPAWVEYHYPQPRSVQVPFDTYFRVEPLQAYHRVITMETFMKDIAPSIWPPGNRTSFCYGARTGAKDENGCNAKEGNPFESFWDTYNIDFDQSEIFQPLYYHTESPKEMRKWAEKYPPADYPVIAFTGPPAPFPVQQQHVRLHQYLQWSDSMASKAQEFIDNHIPNRPFLSVHLRNGPDFQKACEHTKDTPFLFSAAQCIGYRGEFGPATYEMCYPDDKAVVKQVKDDVRRIGAKAVFIATDDRDLINQFSTEMKKVKFVRQPARADPMLDLAIMGQADHFIGNCISSFSAFVKRERDVANMSSSFWSFSPPQKAKEEL